MFPGKPKGFPGFLFAAAAVVGEGLHPRPGAGFGWAELAVLLLRFFTLVLPVPPHFFGLAQRNGVEPQRKALGVVAPP